MLISSKEKEIKMVVTILSQQKTLEYNKISILKIIDKLIKDIEFSGQNKILLSIKVELSKEIFSERKLSELVKRLKSLS